MKWDNCESSCEKQSCCPTYKYKRDKKEVTTRNTLRDKQYTCQQMKVNEKNNSRKKGNKVTDKPQLVIQQGCYYYIIPWKGYINMLCDSEFRKS